MQIRQALTVTMLVLAGCINVSEPADSPSYREEYELSSASQAPVFDSHYRTLEPIEQDLLLVHGYDFLGEAGGSDGLWHDVVSLFDAWGWKGVVHTIGYYGCDEGPAWTQISHRGHHSEHLGGEESHQGRHSCNSNSHDRYTPIAHLAYHFAWTVFEEWNLAAECPVVVAHSMGGLITRYALSQSGMHEEFPPALCIESVVTLGTPHNGHSFDCITTQCTDMKPWSEFMRSLPPHANQAQGTLSTRWWTIASHADLIVPASSATYLTGANKATYVLLDGIHHANDPNYMTAFSSTAGEPKRDATIRLESRLSDSERSGAPWPVRLSFEALANDRVDFGPTVKLASVGYDGQAANGHMYAGHMTPDGRYVLSASTEASNLVHGVSGPAIYRHDLTLGTAVVVMQALPTEYGNLPFFPIAISPDGSRVLVDVFTGEDEDQITEINLNTGQLTVIYECGGEQDCWVDSVSRGGKLVALRSSTFNEQEQIDDQLAIFFSLEQGGWSKAWESRLIETETWFPELVRVSEDGESAYVVGLQGREVQAGVWTADLMVRQLHRDGAMTDHMVWSDAWDSGWEGDLELTDFPNISPLNPSNPVIGAMVDVHDGPGYCVAYFSNEGGGSEFNRIGEEGRSCSYPLAWLSTQGEALVVELSDSGDLDIASMDLNAIGSTLLIRGSCWTAYEPLDENWCTWPGQTDGSFVSISSTRRGIDLRSNVDMGQVYLWGHHSTTNNQN